MFKFIYSPSIANLKLTVLMKNPVRSDFVENGHLPFCKAGMPNIRIITSVIGRAQRGIGRAQMNIGRPRPYQAYTKRQPCTLYLGTSIVVPYLLHLFALLVVQSIKPPGQSAYRWR